jgi:hypothetical protein
MDPLYLWFQSQFLAKDEFEVEFFRILAPQLSEHREQNYRHQDVPRLGLHPYRL